MIVQLKRDADFDLIKTHIKSLTKEDRYLRFGFAASDTNIEDYVNNTFKVNKNSWFGIKNDENILLGTLHIAFGDNLAEFGFTTDSSYRNLGMGKKLFAHGMEIIKELKIRQICLYCLSRNAAMRHIAKSFGLQLMTIGPDVEASITIHYPVPLKEVNGTNEWITLIDSQIIN